MTAHSEYSLQDCWILSAKAVAYVQQGTWKQESLVPSPLVSLKICGGQLMTLGMFLQLNRKLEKLFIVLSL